MQKKKGISLTVLVITIIVMIILASAVVITLENTNMIKRAKKTVSDTDIKNIQVLATTLWTSASLDGLVGEDLTQAVISGLESNDIDVNLVDINVSEDGVKVTKFEPGVKFGKVYQMLMADGIYELVFYADGSATSWVTHFTGEMAGATESEYLPAGTFVYTDTTVKFAEADEVLNISSDGKKLIMEGMEFTIVNVFPGKIQKGVPYIATLFSYNSYIVFEEDGTISAYEDGELMETIPASELTYTDNYIECNGDYMTIYPNGKKVAIPGACAFEFGEGVRFGKKYSAVDDGETVSIVFYADGSAQQFIDGELIDSIDAGRFTYIGNIIVGPDVVVIVSSDRNTIYLNGYYLEIEK